MRTILISANASCQTIHATSWTFLSFYFHFLKAMNVS